MKIRFSRNFFDFRESHVLTKKLTKGFVLTTLLKKALGAFHEGNMVKASKILTVRDFVTRIDENRLSIKVIEDFLKVTIQKEPTLNETNDNVNKTEKSDEKTNRMDQENVQDMEVEEDDMEDRHSMDMLDDFDDENEGIEVNDDPPSPGSV